MVKTNFDTYVDSELENNPDLQQKLHKAEVALDIADQIYTLRQKRGISQTEMAKLIGVKQSNIARLENAEYTGYSLRTLHKITRALDSKLHITMTINEDVASEPIYSNTIARNTTQNSMVNNVLLRDYTYTSIGAGSLSEVDAVFNI